MSELSFSSMVVDDTIAAKYNVNGWRLSNMEMSRFMTDFNLPMQNISLRKIIYNKFKAVKSPESKDLSNDCFVSDGCIEDTDKDKW